MRMRSLEIVAAAALAFPGAISPAQATTRQVIFLDGDPAVASVSSEEILLTQADPNRPTVEFGSALAFGDVNNDGKDDAIVGQRADNRVFVYFGRETPRGAPWYGDPNAADLVIQAPPAGPSAVEGFGFSVASLDLDRNGFDDIVIGAPFSDPGGLADAGLAWVVFADGSLKSGQTVFVGQSPAGAAVVELTRGAASRAGDKLGFAVAAGDLPTASDTFLVVSARDADAVAPQARADAGAAHVLLGSRLPLAGGTVDLSSASTAIIFGDDAADAFGEVVAVCDIDDDLHDDLVVGAIFGDGPSNVGTNRGEALVFLGGNIVRGWPSGTAAASDADMAIYGEGDGDDLGFSVGCGDLDDDGLGDIVLGAVFADGAMDARLSSGEVHVLRGRTSAPGPGSPARLILYDPATSAPQAPVDLAVAAADRTLLGSTAADQLGFSLAVGDFDGDGFGDLAAGARRYDRDQTLVNVGATYILAGGSGFFDPNDPAIIDLHAGTARPFDPNLPAGTPVDHLPDGVDAIIVGASRDDHSAFVLAAGDLNGDGSADLMIGAIGDLARSPGFPGEAYILTLSDRDGDGASDLLDGDNDNDGLSDQDEIDGTLTAGVPTDPLDADTDGDGIQDGTELGLTCAGGGGTMPVACDDPNVPYTSTDPALAPHFVPDADPGSVTDPLDPDSDADGLGDGAEDRDADGAAGAGETDAADQDSDDDGLPDGWVDGANGAPVDGVFQRTEGEDGNLNLAVDAGETDPLDPDTDNDLLPDGLELGLTSLDADVSTTTDPLDADTDADGLRDGVEDADHNGAVGPGEPDPLDQDSDDDGLSDGAEDANGNGVRDPAESSPVNHDTDGDALPDGLELGLVTMLNDTDPLAGHFVPDLDPNTVTEPWDADTDDDGLPDGFIDGYNPNGGGAPGGVADGVASPYEGEDLDGDGMRDPGETDPLTFDTDRDGLWDGVERGVMVPGVLGPDGAADPASGGVQDGTRGGSTSLLDTDDTTLTDPLDGDSDEDGLSDGAEDRDSDGFRDPTEPDPRNPDTDGDLIYDGTEAGVEMPQFDTDTGAGFFVPDADPNFKTDPWNPDTDGGGAEDGLEDADRNGRVDAGERDPTDRRDDDRSGVLEFTETLNGPAKTTPFAPGETLFLRLDDDTDENLDPNVAETLNVACSSTGAGTETEEATLTAVDPDGGVFTGSLATTAAATVPGDGTLTVAAGESVTCTYVDAEDAVDTRTAALVAALTAGAAGEPSLEMTLVGEIAWSVPGGGLLPPAGMTVNLYRGEPATLRATGIYTQVAAACGLAAAVHADGVVPAPGGTLYYLAAGVIDGVEGSLGTDSSGRRRDSSGVCGP